MSDIEQRKKEHIDLCLNQDVFMKDKTTLFECIELDYNNLPEIDMNKIDLSTNFLGKKFSFPFLVSGMTGGAEVAKKINKDIAIACQKMGIGMGLGSMRAMVKHPNLTHTYQVKDVAPDIFLAGNIGAAQIKEYSPKQINEVIDKVNADALAIHINAAQEAMQPEGDLNFENVLERIQLYGDEINVPVYVKEVGHGIGIITLKNLKNKNIKAIDIQGAGGTSWAYIDAIRKKTLMKDTFRDFGIPTALSIINAKKIIKNNKKIIASGGIRNGYEGAKAIVLGADMVGSAMPILKEQNQNGSLGVINYLEKFKKELQITSFLLGAKNISELQKQKYFVFGKLKDLL